MVINLIRLFINLIIIAALWIKVSKVGDILSEQGVFGGEYYCRYFGSLFLYCFIGVLLLYAVNSFFRGMK